MSFFGIIRSVRDSIRERRRPRRRRKKTQHAARQDSQSAHQSFDSVASSLPDSQRESIVSSSFEFLPPVACLFCFEQKQRSDFPSRKPTSYCRRDNESHDVCTSCLGRYITSSVDSKPSIPIICYACGSPFSRQDMEDFAPPDVVQRWETQQLRAFLETVPNFRWCPNPSCSSGQEYEGPDSPCPDLNASSQRVKCASCGHFSCFFHRCAWHHGKTCEEFDQEDFKSQELIKEKLKAKNCPECNFSIEKTGGCTHMTCHCKHEFCWDCLQPSIESHQNGCPSAPVLYPRRH